MFRVTQHIGGLLLAAVIVSPGSARAETERHTWTLGTEIASLSASTELDAWSDGGLGKLRYDAGTRDIAVTRASATLDSRLTPSWRTHVAATYEHAADAPGLTEAYFEWRPVPRSRVRQSLRLGAFYPPLSLENTESDWSSPFTRSFSAINAWVAEELRTLGAEWSLRRAIGYAGARQSISAHAALVAGNDPAGTLLAWKGWALHDRQTSLGEELALPALPQLRPAAMFERQAPVAEPFVETDDRLGYYAGAGWQLRRRARIALTHYDNRADPVSLRRGQYGWRTQFDHLGAQLELPAGLGIVLQWLDGSTAMGPVRGGAHVVDVDVEAAFLLLTKRFGQHRISLRRDDFDTVDNDSTPDDANDETGDAWTLAWRYEHSRRLRVSAEWLAVDSYRPARRYFDETAESSERQLSLGIELALGEAR